MSLRSGYSSVFSPVFDASGNFSGQIDANIPGNLRVGNTGDTYQIFLNGSVFSGGGGGGGDPSNWANYEATSVVNANLKGLIKVNSINYLPVSINPGGQGSNFAAFGANAGFGNQQSTVNTLYAFGNYAGWSNSGDHMYGFGNYAGYRNSGNNLFAAGSNAGSSNEGSNVIAIGNGAGFQNMSDNVIAIGVSAGYNNKGRDVIAIGNRAGYNNSGSYSIFLGSNPNTSISNNANYRFVVYSEDVAAPLMFGDLQNSKLCINGSDFSDYQAGGSGRTNVLTVNGTTWLKDNTKIGSTAGVVISNNSFRSDVAATFASTIIANGTVSLASNLNVSGLATISGATVQNNLNVSGSSAFTGAVSLQSNLNVSGLATISNATVQNNLIVNGLSTISGENIQNNLNVNGLATISGANVQRNLTVNGNVGIGGITSPGVPLDVSGEIRTLVRSSTGASTLITKCTSNTTTLSSQYVIDYLIDSNASGFGFTYAEAKYVYPVAGGSTRGSIILSQRTITKDQGTLKAGDTKFSQNVTVDGSLGINIDPTTNARLDVSGRVRVHDGTTGAPSNGSNGGAGTRVVMWPGTDGSAPPYALGIDGGTLWYGSGGVHRWFTNTQSNMQLDSAGNLTVRGSITASSVNIIPRGVITMWYGNYTNVPSGWVICDGNNGTPNLVGKFVLGAESATSGWNGLDFQPWAARTGGAQYHTLTVNEIPSHSHGIKSRDAGGTGGLDNAAAGGNIDSYTEGAGGGGAHNNMPPFYCVVYIMKT